ncbi:MAG: DNA translocase FtsK [Lachnospiraceae bacterium]|nr:DNA translocase FtsK [Lachnospiraceae bacterium]
MATTNKGRKTTTSGKNSRTSTKAKTNSRQYSEQESALFHEVGLILLFAVAVILFLCNFGVIGTVGDAISGVLFGLFGYLAYIVAIVAFLAAAFWSANAGSPAAVRKLVAGVVLFLMAGVVMEMFTGTATSLESYSMADIYKANSEARSGGGVIAGSLAYLCYHFLDTIGTILVVIILSIISIVLLTEKSFVNSVKNGGRRVAELSREDAKRRRENAALRQSELEEERLRKEEERTRREEEKRLKAEEKENEKILRMDKKVSGVMADTSLTNYPTQDKKDRDDIHEITLNENAEDEDMTVFRGKRVQENIHEIKAQDTSLDNIRIQGAAPEPVQDMMQEEEPWPEMDYIPAPATTGRTMSSVQRTENMSAPPVRESVNRRPVAKLPTEPKPEGSDAQIAEDIHNTEKKVPRKYIFPPLSRLQKGKGGGGDSARELKETAMRLQQTLQTFGVKVTVTDISQGPSVTRYELQPEQGVKVSKIVGLADDIKLNLAATDIRIEAPIPGKAAIGIEVPNKENTAVALRDLLETAEFRDFSSNLAFAVGKDIAGKVVVADIAKMPHMLIAGATGSGKSVCINTLIMSILYKAHPDDVKLIMVDPKVVELNVYNGIPHLLIPVVTDPKKAAAALHWAVSEMTERYKKFADFNVRDLKGYNQKVESMKEQGDETAPAKMPQIVIIVDELADLMMVAPGEVEESICRLAQLARACGIHLIIATQRPSVDVITGLIKANMPSRVAFSVSSGVDSRTILDMNGAEKLLGKGDMLFYPQGYTKPARVQGAFVSDKEVSDVVDFLKNQAIGNVYAEDIEEKIKSMGSGNGGGSAAGSDGGSSLDEYFADAGRFIIEKDKASIGMLQRVFKIGFNRAARIMDQLYDYGVVGEEEGTKPRKVLMSAEQFEQLVEEVV